MPDRLDQRLVGVEEVHVLANHADADRPFGVAQGINYTVPLGQIGLFVRFQAQFVANDLIEAPAVSMLGIVDRVRVLEWNDRPLLDVREQGDLARESPISGRKPECPAAGRSIAHHHDAGGLGLRLASGRDVRHQGEMNQYRVRHDLDPQLADRFEGLASMSPTVPPISSSATS